MPGEPTNRDAVLESVTRALEADAGIERSPTEGNQQAPQRRTKPLIVEENSRDGGDNDGNEQDDPEADAGADEGVGDEGDEIEGGDGSDTGDDLDGEQGDPEGDDGQDGDDEGQEDGYLEVTDDDLFEVLVDGKTKEVSLADLKKNYSLGAATEARLQEATELRRAVQAERTVSLEKFTEAQNILYQSVSQLEGVIVRPMVKAPDESIRANNPTEYLRQVDAYRADQVRMETLRTNLGQFFEQNKEAHANLVKEYAASQQVEVVKKLPILADPVKGKPVLIAMENAARAYGFSDAEIAGAMDSRYFEMVYDAMQWRNLQANKSRTPQKDVKDVTQQGDKNPRKLRSGNTRHSTASPSAARRTAEQTAKEQAKKSGHVNDVADYLAKRMEPPKPRRR